MEGSNNNQRPELRVVVTIPEEGLLISPGMCASEEFKLFKGQLPEATSVENAAYGVTREKKYGLPPMTAYHALGVIDGIHGYAVRPISERTINFRDFTVGKHTIEAVIAHIDEIDEIDGQFVDRLVKRALTRVARSDSRSLQSVTY